MMELHDLLARALTALEARDWDTARVAVQQALRLIERQRLVPSAAAPAIVAVAPAPGDPGDDSDDD
jgi:hypothetical protein